jgi:hypothetical protein
MLEFVEGLTPSETIKGAWSRGGAGSVEAPGSPWSEWEKKNDRANVEKEPSRMSRIGTDGHLIREPLGTSWL